MMVSSAENMAHNALCMLKHLLVQSLLLGVHLKLYILKVTWRELEALVSRDDASSRRVVDPPSHVRFAPAEYICVTDPVCVTLYHLAWNTDKGTERHKILDGIKDGCTGHDPSNSGM
jgi:hypothetical protein